MSDACYAGFPYAYLHERADAKSPKLRQLLWGDRITIENDSPASEFLEVSCRNSRGFVQRAQVQPDHLLDLIFLDVGQGDSAELVTPRGERILVDFGQDDHALRYLRWRYSELDACRFAAAILSHGDADHYGGLRAFGGAGDGQEKFTFDTLFHNGLFDEAAMVQDGDRRYYDHLVDDRASFDALRGDSQLCTTIRAALDSGRIAKLRRLSADDHTLPGLAPVAGFGIEVLGPIAERDAEGRPRLRELGGGYAPTKNGHSVILRVTYGQLKILLGGDLNSPAEDLLLAHYGGGTTGADQIAAVAARMGTDVLKAFHHGSGEFEVAFLRALRPVVTIVSSGDNETYSHPRADALGALGRWSRGDRPLIFSTELARSTVEDHPRTLAKRLATTTAPAERTALSKELDRSVARYGAINVRTDGRRVVVAQKLEKPAAAKEWDLYVLDHAGADWALVSPPPKPPGVRT